MNQPVTMASVSADMRAERIAEKDNWLFSDDELRDIALETQRRESIRNVLIRDLQEAKARLDDVYAALWDVAPKWSDNRYGVHQARLRIENSLQILANEAKGEPRGPL